MNLDFLWTIRESTTNAGGCYNLPRQPWSVQAIALPSLLECYFFGVSSSSSSSLVVVHSAAEDVPPDGRDGRGMLLMLHLDIAATGSLSGSDFIFWNLYIWEISFHRARWFCCWCCLLHWARQLSARISFARFPVNQSGEQQLFRKQFRNILARFWNIPLVLVLLVVLFFARLSCWNGWVRLQSAVRNVLVKWYHVAVSPLPRTDLPFRQSYP